MVSDDFKREIVNCLWEDYIQAIPYYETVFKKKRPVLDHMAIIDLPPSKNTGIKFLRSIFDRIGFAETGKGYLPEKQNDFIWMTDCNASMHKATDSLPQIVLADFRMDLLPKNIQEIVNKYIEQAPEFNFKKLDEFIASGDEENANLLIKKFLLGRAWPTPTVSEYSVVKEHNQLLAWVLLFGRKVNHFGVNITFEKQYTDLWDFNSYIKNLNYAELNSLEGEVKGGAHQGIAQSSTRGQSVVINASDGEVEANNSFMEFVWRYPVTSNPQFWNDYFTGFVSENANKVIESLYDDKEE